VEVLVDQLPGLHGLRPAGLPAGAGQRGLDPRGQEAEAERNYEPADEHDPEVGGGEPAQPADRPDVDRMRILLCLRVDSELALAFEHGHQTVTSGRLAA
jgi:hypothetical protein